jgi:hypothetical protein
VSYDACIKLSLPVTHSFPPLPRPPSLVHFHFHAVL